MEPSRLSTVGDDGEKEKKKEKRTKEEEQSGKKKRERRKILTLSRRAFSAASTSSWLTKLPAPPRPPDLKVLDIVALKFSVSLSGRLRVCCNPILKASEYFALDRINQPSPPVHSRARSLSLSRLSLPLPKMGWSGGEQTRVVRPSCSE